MSIYLGYLFLELLKVFQTPNIKWEVVNVEGQVYLKIQNLGDVLNKIFKLNTLSRLHAIIEIQSKTVFGRWISNPEPVSLGTSLNGQLVLLPDYSKIAFNRSTDILPYTYDNIVLLWKKSYQALTEYYIVDEFRYLPPYRYAPQNRIILPNIVKVTLYTEEDRYNLEINLDL
ncbi:hypothetical protein JW865_04550 [Candidatus Bathyarchaeota archaeon]|nr:hypothetical protein [Candidatus Bathyarchaeota archaeon]